MQEEVNSLLKGVINGRRNLSIATQHFTSASLGILANYRKRTLIKQLLKSLHTIKTLVRKFYFISFEVYHLENL